MKLIIQIPAYNEIATIEKTLRELPKKIDGISAIETLVIDDGSSDGTAEAARRAGATTVLRLLSHRGLAAAFIAGIDQALRRGADIIVNTDADNQYVAADIARLVEPIVARRAEVVIGDRGVSSSPHMSPFKRLLQRLGSSAVTIVAGIEVSDATSGFRAFSRDAAFQLNVFNPFTYTLETIIQAGIRNLRVESVRVSTNPPSRPSRLYRGMGSYIRKSVVTIFRVYTLYRPLKTFFAIGGLLFLAGVLIGFRFLFHYLEGNGGGHIQSLILSAVLLVSGFQTILVGLVADLISVNRRLSEEILIRLRRSESRLPDRKRERERRPVHGTARPLPEAEKKTEAAQWIWLGEEKKEPRGRTETQVPPPPSQPGRKRRRRRRPERPVNRERPPHHHEPHDKPDE